MVAIQLDSRREGVDVPSEHMEQMALVLNLSRKFNQRILELEPLRVLASLSFGGTAYSCAIPYQAIYSIVSQSEGKHYLFAESLPAEMSAAAPAVEPVDEDAGGDEALVDTSMDSVVETDAQSPPNADEPPPPPAGPPTLRLIK